MALCGFNEKMLHGLKEFFDGAIEYGILERSKNKEISIDEQFKNEFDELSQWCFYSKNISDGSIQKIIEGLGLVVAGIFEKDQKEGIDKYKEIHELLTKFLSNIDDVFYGDLEGNKESMHKLFDWVNDNLRGLK